MADDRRQTGVRRIDLVSKAPRWNPPWRREVDVGRPLDDGKLIQGPEPSRWPKLRLPELAAAKPAIQSAPATQPKPPVPQATVPQAAARSTGSVWGLLLGPLMLVVLAVNLLPYAAGFLARQDPSVDPLLVMSRILDLVKLPDFVRSLILDANLAIWKPLALVVVTGVMRALAFFNSGSRGGLTMAFTALIIDAAAWAFFCSPVALGPDYGTVREATFTLLKYQAFALVAIWLLSLPGRRRRLGQQAA